MDTSGRDGNRPTVHFTAPRNWLNDPNGLAAFKGRWHLFYQHHPDSPEWGPMHWGHAVGEDCMEWKDAPLALVPGESFDGAFSGCAVVDRSEETLAVHGGPQLTVFFTAVHMDGDRGGRLEEQRWGYWDEAADRIVLPQDNLVLSNPGLTDFRDPQVVFLGGPFRWSMVLACGNHLRFYGSDDLRRWTETGRYALGDEDGSSVLECPNLIRLPAEDGCRWVLAVSRVDRRSRDSRTVYLTGRFDGSSFTADTQSPLPVDCGHDFYAPQVWFDDEGLAETPRWIGWLNNWAYADRTAGSGWNGILSIPRTLSLRRVGGELRLVQLPAAELEAYVGAAVSPERSEDGVRFSLSSEQAYLLRGRAEAPRRLTVRLSCGGDELYSLSVRPGEGRGFLRRGLPFLEACGMDGYGVKEFHFPALADEPFDFCVIVDGCVVEAFLAGGLISVGELISRGAGEYELTLEGAGGVISALGCFNLKSAMRPIEAD